MSCTFTDGQIVAGDKRLRNQVILGLLLFALVVFFVHQGLSAYIEGLKALIETRPQQAVRKITSLLTIFALIHGILTLSFSSYFVVTGSRIWKARRYPPPGMRVIKDTRISLGGKARAMAILHFMIAVTILSTNLFLWRFGALLEKMVRV